MMRRCVIALILASAVLSSPVCAQEEKTITLPANGPDFFSHILFSQPLIPLQSFQEAENDPRDSMIILFGAPHGKDVVRFMKEGMKAFLGKGGTLLVASDYRIVLGDPLWITVTGIRVERPAEMGYRGNEFCPWLDYSKPLADRPQTPITIFRDVRDHPVFRLLEKGIATNCPSHIEFNQRELAVKRLLNFPNEGGELREEAPTYVAGSPRDAQPEGRVLVIAGHGAFMNSIMLQRDNDNFAFAINCVRWLREKSDGTKRRHALFVVDGAIITNFDRNLTPPLPIPVPTATTINRLLRGLEDEGLFHKALADVLGDFHDRVVPFLIGVATCVLLLYGGKKFLEGRHAREIGVPRMVGVPSGIAEPTPRGEQHQRALFRARDPSAEARALIAQWLQSAFGVTPEDWAAAGGAAEFRAAGFLGSGWPMQRRANHVLDLLRSAGPTKVSRRDFVLLVETLSELNRAAQEGRLTLLLDGKEVRQTGAN